MEGEEGILRGVETCDRDIVRGCVDSEHVAADPCETLRGRQYPERAVVPRLTHLGKQSTTTPDIQHVHSLQPPSLPFHRTRSIPRFIRPPTIIHPSILNLLPHKLHPRRVHLVQEAKFAAFVPPLRGEAGKVVDFGLVDGGEGGWGGGGCVWRRR